MTTNGFLTLTFFFVFLSVASCGSTVESCDAAIVELYPDHNINAGLGMGTTSPRIYFVSNGRAYYCRLQQFNTTIKPFKMAPLKRKEDK